MCSKADHEVLKADATRWEQLTWIGEQLIEADETGPAERLELRNCKCGSTLAILRPVGR